MSENPLCSRCRMLRIPLLFHGPRYETEDDLVDSEDLDVKIASIAELTERPDCDLCQNLLKIYEYELTGHSGHDDEGAGEYWASRANPRKIYCILRPVRADLILDYDPCGMEHAIATHLLIEFDPAVPAMLHTWKQDQADTKRGDDSYPQLGYKTQSLYRGYSIALDYDSAVPERPLMNRSGQKSDIIDFQQMRNLLSTCRIHHPVCNSTLERTTDGTKAPAIMLLDVSNRVMIRADPNFRYVALSYVWDFVDREGYPGFQNGFPEGSTVPDLPLIMEDAISIAKQLNEKYVWIDLLCINQNDPIIKKKQIKQMNIIYSHAELTIVVLARSNVHGGIPGIRPKTRRVEHRRLRIGDKSLSVGMVWRHFFTMAGSTWNSRGWTLEEGMLSRRCLVFGPNEVFFDCCSGVGSETLGLPIYKPPVIDYPQQQPLPNEKTAMSSLKHIPRYIGYKFWNKSFPDKWSFAFYAQSVQAYSERDLSHARDSLNAFLGVLVRVTLNTNMRFIQGIPQDDIFLTGLLWFPSFDSHRIHGFPSWTWAGWTGPKHYCAVYHEFINSHYNSVSDDKVSGHKLAHVAVPDVHDEGHGSTALIVSSQTRRFPLRTHSPTLPVYGIDSPVDGRLVQPLLGSRGNHDQSFLEKGNGLLHLDAYPPGLATGSEELPGLFVYLLRWITQEKRKERDHVLAILVREVDDGNDQGSSNGNSVADTDGEHIRFERVALCGIPAAEWEGAPVVEGMDRVVLI